MASYSQKLSEKKYNNWVKAQLAVLFTKDGLEPFVCHEVQEFRLKCLNDICYNNRLISGTLCSNCCTENVIKCPTNRICSVGRGKCSYHRNAATRYNPAGCPNKICHNFSTETQNVHRYYGPSYKNTDATQWCSNSWEIAKCFMPPDGYKDIVSAHDTDFNGIISVIINHKDFQGKIHENLGNKNNIFEQAREIGRNLRHSSTLEVEDTDLHQYFIVLQQLLSDAGYLATDMHAQHAKQKLIDLENDILVIGKDDIMKVLDNVAKATRDTITEELIKRKQEDLLSLDSKSHDGLQQNETKIDDSLKTIENQADKSVKDIEKARENSVQIMLQKEKVKTQSKRIREECERAVETIKEEGDKGRIDKANLAETLEETLYTRINDDKEKQYIDDKQKFKDVLITWYNTFQSTVPLSPLTDGFDTHLVGFYVMPGMNILVNLPGGKKEKTRVKSLQGLFTSGSNDLKEIYLCADAGFGKTAFSKYLAITWCQAHKNDDNYKHFEEDVLQALSGFEFMFLVLLRDSATECGVYDMIKQQIINNLPCKSEIPKNLLNDILRNEKCLVILDGLDEWTHPDNDCSRLPKIIPHRYASEKCVILTTTRSWKLGISNLRTCPIDRTVELVKFTKESARQFKINVMKILNVSLQDDVLIQKVCRFEEEIRDHDLEDVESTPLLLLYLICVWIEKIPIGNSAVKLYTGIIQLILSRTEKLYGKFHSSCETSTSNVPECFRKHIHFCSYYTYLVNIGELAFYTLFRAKKESKLVFDKYIAEKYLTQNELKSSCLSGILSESKVKTLLNERSKISFSHKTVQEYFSAIFISFRNTSEVQKIIFVECNCLQNILDMSKVFVFISSMNPKLMSAISSNLMPVINNDEKTSKYRTRIDQYSMHSQQLQDIQDMYIWCAKEGMENKDLKLCLQDFIINEKCHQENYFQQLRHLCQQNKKNIKSMIIENEGMCSLQEIVNLFTLSDLPHIEKLYYSGEIVEEEIVSLLLNPLKCLALSSCIWENHKFLEEPFRLSAEINGQLVKLQHLECLYIHSFTMSHEVLETLLNFLTSKKSMKEITLESLNCSDHDTSCRGFTLDLSQHSQLRCLGLLGIPVSPSNIDVSLLEECTVGELYKPGVVSSYLSQLPAASKLHTFTFGGLDSSSDIETMLQILPLLHHVKHVMLCDISLGERSLILSPQMTNIELVTLCDITMSCPVLYNLITVINKLPQTVTIQMAGCDKKPTTEFENFKIFIKHSDNFVVTYDDTSKSGEYRFDFNTTQVLSNLK
ncbi:uncharacterized protein LOC132732643 [Ruditapes philippinarum]|uniref:uncharacterized protein LOC132732643 n=1 Tax=Ruditapes philippinarum TaxID=129788 RepID=UPI00295BC4A9|nr:uncharacterized protein LOC132732643 [Ruditapes philippinarum]XP_060575100.1 uncharacterized protein LOC132732643 [Ruditapes philippinarum]